MWNWVSNVSKWSHARVPPKSFSTIGIVKWLSVLWIRQSTKMATIMKKKDPTSLHRFAYIRPLYKSYHAINHTIFNRQLQIVRVWITHHWNATAIHWFGDDNKNQDESFEIMHYDFSILVNFVFVGKTIVHIN